MLESKAFRFDRGAATTGGFDISRVIGVLAMLLALVCAWSPAQAQPPRYAAFMVDAASREVLYTNAPDEPRHPASLTKIMTLYLVFDALEAGRLSLNDRVPISRFAASQKPSRLGLAVGQSISVDNAISVVAVKSANDIAVALAERLGGTADNFTAMMNAKAAQLGMRRTHYANPSGLPDPTNITTARDLAILSLALIRNHPRFYRYFGERDFVWERSTLINHNHMLGRTVGMDGIKTGYTVDSGFTLAASAQRGNRRLIAIVLGEPSLVARTRDVGALLEAGFSVLDRRALGQQATVASVLPTLDHPALRTEPYVEQGSVDATPRVSPGPRLRAVPRGRATVTRHRGKVAKARPERGHKAKTSAKTSAKSKSKSKSGHSTKTTKPATSKKAKRHHR